MFKIDKKNNKFMDFFSLDILVSIIFLLFFLIDLIFLKLGYSIFFCIFLFFIFFTYIYFLLKIFPLKFNYDDESIREIKNLIKKSNFNKIILLFFRFVFLCSWFYELINLYSTYNYLSFINLFLLYLFVYCLFFIEIIFGDKILIKKISYFVLAKDFLVLDLYEDYNGFYLLSLMDENANEFKIKMSILNYCIKLDYTKFNFIF